MLPSMPGLPLSLIEEYIILTMLIFLCNKKSPFVNISSLEFHFNSRNSHPALTCLSNPIFAQHSCSNNLTAALLFNVVIGSCSYRATALSSLEQASGIVLRK